MNRELFNFIKYNTPDDGAGGGDLTLEGVFEPKEEEEFFFLEGDADIPIPDEEPLEDLPEIKALKDQNTLLQQQMTSLQTQADSTAALTKGLETLGQNLKIPPVQQVQSQVDPSEAAKEFNLKFYDDPAKNLDAFAKAKIEPALQQMLMTNANYSKQFLLLDPERTKVYEQYGKEVEEVFNQLPPQKKFQDPNSYKEAADIVASRHISETRASMKEEILKEVMAELKINNLPDGQQQPGQHSEQGHTKKVIPKGKSFVLPTAVWNYAGKMGYQGRGEKEDQGRVYQWWKEGKLSGSGIEYK